MQQNTPIPFTLIIPGSPPIASFQLTNGIFHLDLPNPSQIQYLTLVLISQLPPSTALSLSYSLPPNYSSINYIGAVTNTRPTDTFSTGWGMDQQISNLPLQSTIDPNTGQIINTWTSLKICIKVDTFENLQELDKLVRQDARKTYARCVAQNLYNFMGSYGNPGDVGKMGGDYLVVPQNFLNKWFLKFEDKFRKDPNFILKTTDQ